MARAEKPKPYTCIFLHVPCVWTSRTCVRKMSMAIARRCQTWHYKSEKNTSECYDGSTEGSAANEGLVHRLGVVRPLGGDQGGALDHLGVTHRDPEHLPGALQGILLHVEHTVLSAGALHQRLQLPVLQRSHVREHVVLNLVVEPPVHGVDDVVATLKVRGGMRTAAEPLGAVGLARSLVAVEVPARVVAGDDYEGVRICEELREHRHAQRPPRGGLGGRGEGPGASSAQQQRRGRGQRHHDGHGRDNREPHCEEGGPEDRLLQRAPQQRLGRILDELEDRHRVPALRAGGPILRQPRALAGNCSSLKVFGE
mmetsp:Transcript_69529/g.193467  ORF Transcript_69529/g.193467 Transcript_69529/m.193467 type:complete len:312 (+) Transcript_69529:117-1052(+)